jgi:hypothetical protein
MLCQSVRQHALSMLTDSFLDKRGGLLPVEILCEVLGNVCIPLAGKRILELRAEEIYPENLDTMTIELELCIGLIFKPLRHHIKTIMNEDPSVLLALWAPTLGVLKEVLKEPSSESALTPGSEKGDSPRRKIIRSTNELTLEHLRNVIMVLISFGVLKEKEESPDDLTAQTWKAISEMGYCNKFLDEWKQAAVNQPDNPV